MLVTAAARLDLTPLRPTAYYLLEAYSTQEATGTLRLRVADSTGKALITTAETPVQVPAGGGVLKGQLDLAGLPPGHYAMVAALHLGGKYGRALGRLHHGARSTRRWRRMWSGGRRPRPPTRVTSRR